jgi:hypothetical protein
LASFSACWTWAPIIVIIIIIIIIIIVWVTQ